MDWLKMNKPYLYKIEMTVKKIQDSTGYGDVSVSLRIIKNIVDKISLLHSEDEMLKQRKNNVFD